jgi:hypothetical protein
LNLVGFIVPGERVAAISGKYVSFRDGIAVEGDQQLIPTLSPKSGERMGHPHPREAAAN